MVKDIDMGGMEVVGLGMVNMMMVDRRVTVAEVVELAEVELEVVGLNGGGCGRELFERGGGGERGLPDEGGSSDRGLFVGRSNPLRCVPLARLRSSSRREIFLIFWTTVSMVDSRILGLSLKVFIFMDKFSCSLSFSVIVRALKL